MGSASSVNATKDEQGAHLSTTEIAKEVAALGDAYLPYAKRAEENGIDGAFLMDCTEGDLKSLFDDLQVTSITQKKKLSLTFKNFRESRGSSHSSDDFACVTESNSDVLMKELSPLPTITEGKRHRGLLSHSKYECGTEARLIHKELSEILPDEEFFLDSGACNK